MKRAKIFKLLRGDFEVFWPCRATRCTIWDEIYLEEVDHWSSMPNFTPVAARMGYETAKTESVSEIYQTIEYKRPQGRILCAIFTKFVVFVGCFRMQQLLKFGWICYRSYGVMGVLS